MTNFEAKLVTELEANLPVKKHQRGNAANMTGSGTDGTLLGVASFAAG
jgi:hypothetical protein